MANNVALLQDGPNETPPRKDLLVLHNTIKSYDEKAENERQYRLETVASKDGLSTANADPSAAVALLAQKVATNGMLQMMIHTGIQTAIKSGHPRFGEVVEWEFYQRRKILNYSYLEIKLSPITGVTNPSYPRGIIPIIKRIKLRLGAVDIFDRTYVDQLFTFNALFATEEERRMYRYMINDLPEYSPTPFDSNGYPLSRQAAATKEQTYYLDLAPLLFTNFNTIPLSNEFLDLGRFVLEIEFFNANECIKHYSPGSTPTASIISAKLYQRETNDIAGITEAKMAIKRGPGLSYPFKDFYEYRYTKKFISGTVGTVVQDLREINAKEVNLMTIQLFKQSQLTGTNGEYDPIEGAGQEPSSLKMVYMGRDIWPIDYNPDVSLYQQAYRRIMAGGLPYTAPSRVWFVNFGNERPNPLFVTSTANFDKKSGALELYIDFDTPLTTDYVLRVTVWFTNQIILREGMATVQYQPGGI